MFSPRNAPSPHCHPLSLDSGSTPEAFAAREKELGTGTLTCTDHGSLAAGRRIYDLARSEGLTPVVGLEGYLRDDNCPILKKHGIEIPKDYAKYFHFTCHFLDQRAFEVASRILSNAPTERHGSERKPLFNWANLEELCAENVTLGSGCLIGYTQRHLMQHGAPEIAFDYYEKARSLVKPGNFLAELFPHRCTQNWVVGVQITLEDGTVKLFHDKKNLRTNKGEIHAIDLAKAWNRKDHGEHVQLESIKNYRKWDDCEPAKIMQVTKLENFVVNECSEWAPDGDVQIKANRFVLELARHFGDPVMISDDSHFAVPENKIVQDIKLSQGGPWKFANSYHRQSSLESWSYFHGAMGIGEKEFEGWIDNAFAWADRFKSFKFDYKPAIAASFYPANSLAETMRLIDKHGRMRWDNPVYCERLKAEIDLLHSNGTIDLLPYPQLFEEVCDLYSQRGELTGVGRGSGGGLLLHYLMSITHMDPIRYKLSVARFITESRIKSNKLPDIDQDLGDTNILVGEEQPGFEVLLEDGTKKIVKVDARVLTIEGEMPIQEAFRRKLDIEKWIR